MLISQSAPSPLLRDLWLYMTTPAIELVSEICIAVLIWTSGELWLGFVLSFLFGHLKTYSFACEALLPETK